MHAVATRSTVEAAQAICNVLVVDSDHTGKFSRSGVLYLGKEHGLVLHRDGLIGLLGLPGLYHKHTDARAALGHGTARWSGAPLAALALARTTWTITLQRRLQIHHLQCRGCLRVYRGSTFGDE